MEKLDLKKTLKHLYNPPSKDVVSVDVPSMRFLMIDGQGDPNTSAEYAQAIEALYSASYAIKFAAKKGELGIDYGVMPLEGLWWADDMSAFADSDRDEWLWTMMIMQPDVVPDELVSDTLAAVAEKKPVPGFARMRFEPFAEGLSAQVMHIGPFSEEAPNIERVHDFIASSGHTRFGKHHEIYLSDIRKAAPSKWKTVIRQPMR